MGRILITVLALLMFLCSTLPGVFAQDDAMAKFYGGLADILEQNMENPEACLNKINAFVGKNQKLIDDMQSMMEENRQKAMSQSYSQTDIQEMQQKMQGMMQGQGFSQMNRFMQAMQAFSTKHSWVAEQIGEKLDMVSPQYR